MVNINGRNQYNNGVVLPDETLKDMFRAWSRERNGRGLTYEEQIARLAKEGVFIKRSALVKLRRRLQVPSVRKSKKPLEHHIGAVVDLKANDPLDLWGVDQVRGRLAQLEVLLPRDDLRRILHDHFDDGFAKRFPGRNRQDLPRTPLYCAGPWAQVHCDGHEKLSSQALKIGAVSLEIYGYKDQFSSNALHLVLAPGIRRELVIGHVYLDWVELKGVVALQQVMDKGSETGLMIRLHEALRVDAAPEFSVHDYPPTIQVQSKHNTPIEGFWRWLRRGEGMNIRDIIIRGYNEGRFDPNNALHIATFNWLWPPLVQQRLDAYREYWNSHTIRKQPEKMLPSGHTPHHMLTVPESVDLFARDCSIRVRMAKVRELRSQIGGYVMRNELLQFVSEEFRATADDALLSIGNPAITLMNAWDIFDSVVDVLKTASDYI